MVALAASSVFVASAKAAVPDLTDEQKAELRTMMEEFRAEMKTTVEAKLSDLGIQIAEGENPRELMSSLTQEQRDAIRADISAMRDVFREQVKAQLGEWGVQLPEPGTGPFNGERPSGFGRFAGGHRGGLGFCNPQVAP